MSRCDVPELKVPSRLPRWFPEAIEERLHSGPFCPWRPELQTFGTVSQRVLVCDAERRQTHYFYRPTNIGSPPQVGPWRRFVLPWRLAQAQPALQQAAKL
ncbi:unnamed protein product [Symbiodinium natans]|uniref:Uncharacterized protein n=1 Tax=Symbiodinium natans TaxID=878477 RepID=A0A812HDV3_9DINO|nr:unnamed protein product [Symbiodinium natans]